MEAGQLNTSQMNRTGYPVASKTGRSNLIDTDRPIGDIHRPGQIAQQQTDDLAKTKSHNGQIVATQPQDGKAKHHAEAGGHSPGDGQAKPEA